jgi:hypothetical protein
MCLLEELKIKSQHRTSRPKRLSNEVLQIALGRILSVTVQSLDTGVILIKFWFPKAEVSAPLVY